jgi:predicted DNA-binding transcriptional regulator YafY
MPKKGDSLLKLYRIVKIHQLLRSNKSYSAAELVEYLSEIDGSVNERKIGLDIQSLRNLGADIKGHRFGGFFYQQPFSLLNALEGVDTAEMDEVISFIRQLAKTKAAFFELDKLLLHLEQRVRAEGYADNPFLEFERVETKNINRLDEFYRYVTEKRVREIEYTPFDSELETKVIFPVILREFNNRWTLIAFDKAKNAYQNFALDRIGKVRLSTATLVDGNNFDSKTYFKDVIGNTIESDTVERIVFTVLKRRAFYVETKPWHHSQQKISEDEESITFELQIKPNREFWAKVMEHIEDIEINEPEVLRIEFQERVQKIYDRIF